jgi:hypothetical protein
MAVLFGGGSLQRERDTAQAIHSGAVDGAGGERRTQRDAPAPSPTQRRSLTFVRGLLP